MRKICISCLLFLSLLVTLHCSSDDPSTSKDTVEFILTATDYVPQPPVDYQPPNTVPPLGQAVCYDFDPRSTPQNQVTYPPRPVSIEYRPEIRIYKQNSETYQLVDIDPGFPNDPEYFGRTPFDTVCLAAQQQTFEADPNYQFSIDVNNEKVVGIFKKKLYEDEYSWRNDANLVVSVYVNGSFWRAFETNEPNGALTIIIPIQ